MSLWDLYDTGNANYSKLQVLSLHGNPIGEGGAMKALKCLYRCKTPLQELDLAYIGMGEEDCEPLALLIANTDTLQKLDPTSPPAV